MGKEQRGATGEREQEMMRSSAYIMTVSIVPRSCSGKITKDATRENSADPGGP